MDPLQVHPDRQSEIPWRLTALIRRLSRPCLLASLLFLLWQVPLSADAPLPRGIAGMPMRPIGTNAPAAAADALMTLVDRVQTAARPGPAPTDTMAREYMADLEKYLQDWPESPWNPAVRQELAKLNEERLHYARAEQLWSANVETMIGLKDPVAIEYANEAIARRAQVLAWLGDLRTLGEWFARFEGRVLDDAPLSHLFEQVRQQYYESISNPESTGGCGNACLLALSDSWLLDPKRIAELSSQGKAKISLRELSNIASSAGGKTRGIQLKNETALPYPSLVHLRYNHFIAILDGLDDVYTIYRPELAAYSKISEGDLREEMTGYMLVLNQDIRMIGRELSPVEMDAVRGDQAVQPPLYDEQEETCSCEDDDGFDFADGESEPSCQNLEADCTGCTGSVVYSMPKGRSTTSVHLMDNPLVYRPSKGIGLRPLIAMKQYGFASPAAGLNTLTGAWRLSWGIYAQETSSHAEVNVFLRGARRRYFFPLEGSQYGLTSLPHPRDGSRLVWEENRSKLSLRFRGGRRFEFNGGVSGTGRLLSKVTSAANHSIIFVYDANGYLQQVVDADGQATTLMYQVYGGTPRLWKIQTPDNRYVEFGYQAVVIDSANNQVWRLTSIRDAAGTVSTLIYPGPNSGNITGASWVPEAISTPDGTTSVDFFTGAPAPFNRVVTIRHGDGTRERFARTTQSSVIPEAFPGDVVPTESVDLSTGEPVSGTGTLAISGRNQRLTLWWNGKAMDDLGAGNPLDPLPPTSWGVAEYRRASVMGWLAAPIPVNTLSTAPRYHQAPSPDGTVEGQVTFFDVEGKLAIGMMAANGSDLVVLRVRRVLVETGTQTWWEYTPRDSRGRVLRVRNTYSLPGGGIGNRVVRSFVYVYSPDGMDLQQEDVRDGQGNLRERRVWALGTGGLPRRLSTFSQWWGPGASDAYTTTYAYDPIYRTISSEATSAGATTTWTYTPGSGSNALTVVRTTSPVFSSVTEVYQNGRMVQQTDARGLVLNYQYDELDRLTRVTWPDTTTAEYDYTRVVNGQTLTFLDVQREKDRLNRWSTNTYNGSRKLVERIDSAGRKVSYTNCSCGQVVSVTLGTGGEAETTRYTYQADGRLKSIVHPGGRTQTFTYNLLGQRVSETDGAVTTSYTYNLQGLLTQTSLPAGIVRKVVYDIEDRPWQVTDANGVTVTQTYDFLDRLTLRSYPAVSGGQGITAESFAYSARGQTDATDQRGKITSRTFDELGRLKTETTPNTPAETVTYGYNAAGDLISMTDGRSKATTWTYNAEGRLTGKRYHGQNFDQVTYGYYADGRLNWRRYYSSPSLFRQTTYTYDPSGNLTLIDYPSPTVDVSAGYNSANRLTNVVQPGLGTINLGWANGRLIQESGPWPNSAVTRVFPANAFRPNELRVQNNATPAQDWVVAYGYDSSGRLQDLTSPVGPFTYSYTGAAGSGYAGALVDEIQLPGGGKVNHDWDGLGRLALTEFRNNPANGSAVQNRHTYSYDLANRRNQQVRTGSSAVTLNYGYDDLGQLTSASIVGGASTAYGYDAGWNMANRAGQAYAVNDLNQVTAGEGFTYSYDANGNRTGRTTTSTGQFIQYTYDDENRLIVAQTDVVATVEQGRWRTEFTYDGFGRLRNRRELNWQFGGWYETTQTRYLYDGWRVVQERAGTLPQVAYTRGLDLSGSLEGAGGIGGLLARSSSYQSASGTYASHAFYHADGGGNVTFLSPSTYTGSGSEAALTRYVYDAFGRTTSATGPLWSNNLYRFSSKEVHVASGMYYYGYRFYDPQAQRWLNRDPILESGGINLYGMVGNNPVSGFDALGLWRWDNDIIQVGGPQLWNDVSNGWNDFWHNFFFGSKYQPPTLPPDSFGALHGIDNDFNGRTPGELVRDVGLTAGSGLLDVLSALKLARSLKQCKDAARRVNPFELAPTHPITKSRGEFAKLKADIAKNGVKEPISYIEHNGQKYILDGHHRARAAKELGLKDVPIQEVQLPFKGYITIDDVLKGGW